MIISLMKVTKEVPVIVMNEELDITTLDVPDLNNLQIPEQ